MGAFQLSSSGPGACHPDPPNHLGHGPEVSLDSSSSFTFINCYILTVLKLFIPTGILYFQTPIIAAGFLCWPPTVALSYGHVLSPNLSVKLRSVSLLEQISTALERQLGSLAFSPRRLGTYLLPTYLSNQICSLPFLSVPLTEGQKLCSHPSGVLFICPACWAHLSRLLASTQLRSHLL